MNPKRKKQREEFKAIEAALHPTLQIGDIDILHEHRGQKIIFTSWKGNKRVNEREMHLDRSHVLLFSDALDESSHRWLVGLID